MDFKKFRVPEDGSENFDRLINGIVSIAERNTVNTRLFGACKPEKIILDLSHYAKSRPA